MRAPPPAAPVAWPQVQKNGSMLKLSMEIAKLIRAEMSRGDLDNRRFAGKNPCVIFTFNENITRRSLIVSFISTHILQIWPPLTHEF
jgi:hypothetical protein